MLKEKIPRRNDVALGIFSYLPTRSLSSKLGWHSQLRLLTTFSILQYGQDTLPHEVEFALQVAVVGSDGDDDEASAWLWLHETYPTAQFVPFSTITAANVIEPFRVLFWLRKVLAKLEYKEKVGKDA